MSTGRCISCNSSFPVTPEVAADSPSFRDPRYNPITLVIYLVLVVAFVLLGLSGRVLLRRLGQRYVAQSLRHVGPVARLDQLKGTGRIYLVQMGDHKDPYSLDDFAKWLRTKYALDVQVLPSVKIDKSAWNESRKQYVAESLCAQMNHDYPDLAADPDAYLIGFTDGNMYTVNESWQGTFTQRDWRRAAIISSDSMQDSRFTMDKAAATEHFHARLRRILLKDVAILYWHLPFSSDRTSLLHNTLDPDVPAEDIFESDVNPALSSEGELEREPCIFFEYSPRLGMKPMPGRLIRGCNEDRRPEEDTTVERFEFDLRLGLLIDMHTDFNLPDDIPIQFERVTRDGWRNQNPFGISGTDSYDEFLSSPDNITISVVAADTSRRELVRVPRNVSNLALVKYVDTTDPGLDVLRWQPTPFEHYDLKRFDGAVKAYLPCMTPSILCYQIGYRSPQGQELKFERGEHRRLMRLTSPNQSSIRLEYTPVGSISTITDTTGRVVRYGYDAKNRLISVAYPSGESCHYEYDDAQHLLTFSVAHTSNAVPSTLMRNEYANGLLVKQTLADGSVYSYDYTLSDKHLISGVTVQSADGRLFKLNIGQNRTFVHEQPDHSSPENAAVSK
jgi:YD repeat-containing protein